MTNEILIKDSSNPNISVWNSNDGDNKLYDLRLELWRKCQHRTPFAEANKEFAELAEALEYADPQEVYETIWDTVLGCGTPSSEYDPQNASDTAFELNELLEFYNLVQK